MNNETGIIEEAIRTLMGWLETAAPHVLEAAKQSVMASIVSTAIWAVLLLGMTIAMIYVTKLCYRYAKNTDSDWDIAALFAGIATVVLAIITTILVTDIARYTVAFDWHVIQRLASLIPIG